MWQIMHIENAYFSQCSYFLMSFILKEIFQEDKGKKSDNVGGRKCTLVKDRCWTLYNCSSTIKNTGQCMLTQLKTNIKI